MGEVYRARDTRLDRSVAIKFLTPALADNPKGRERFEREARAISKLAHPHICTLLDIGSGIVRGVDARYLVMEFVEGETLAARLRRGPCRRQRPLPRVRRSPTRSPRRMLSASFIGT